MCVTVNVILPSKFIPAVVTTILFGLFTLFLLHYTLGIPVVWATFHNWWHAEKKRQTIFFFSVRLHYLCFPDAIQVSFFVCTNSVMYYVYKWKIMYSFWGLAVLYFVCMFLLFFGHVTFCYHSHTHSHTHSALWGTALLKSPLLMWFYFFCETWWCLHCYSYTSVIYTHPNVRVV